MGRHFIFQTQVRLVCASLLLIIVCWLRNHIFDAGLNNGVWTYAGDDTFPSSEQVIKRKNYCYKFPKLLVLSCKLFMQTATIPNLSSQDGISILLLLTIYSISLLEYIAILTPLKASLSTPSSNGSSLS